MQPGDRVRLHEKGKSVFTILEIEGDTATIEAIHATAPGVYPFNCRISELVPDASTPE